MPTSRNALEIDAGRIFRWSFLTAFLLFEWIIWQNLPPRLGRRPGHRLLVFIFAPWATRRAALVALMLATAVTLGVMLFVRLIVSPMLNRWLRPAVDPSSWMFHLSAGETPAASVPARFRSMDGWHPGSLVLTGRRLWFVPSAWGPEPWSMVRSDFGRVEAEPPGFVRWLPMRHWPERLIFTDRAGNRATFVVADPDAVLQWFAKPRDGDVALPRPRVVPEGVFDA